MSVPATRNMTSTGKERCYLAIRGFSWSGAGSALLLLCCAGGNAQAVVAEPHPPALVVAQASAADSVPSPYRIKGRVIDSLSKTSLGKAEITVSPMGARRSNTQFVGRSGGRTVTVTADAAGRFEVQVPSAGGWSVTAAARGYHTQALEEHEGYSTAVILTETNPAYDVLFPLTPEGVIQGYVLDEAGEAVRNAQLSLSQIPAATPENLHPKMQSKGNQRTDDRGFYKFSGLLSGNYDVRVQAQPWYASNGAGGIRGGIGAVAGGGLFGLTASGGAAAKQDAAAPDPLDVVYPPTWYPGVSDLSGATPIALRGGETREANFRLLPIPGFHLRIASGADGPGDEARPGVVGGRRSNAYLTQVMQDGTETGVPTSMHADSTGNMEFSGLAPGTYVIHQMGESVPTGSSVQTIRISPNSAHTVDVSEASQSTIVAVKIDATADLPSLQITFRDLDTGRLCYAQRTGENGFRGRRRGVPMAAAPEVSADKDSALPDRTVNLQPGRYEVTLNGIGELHISSMEASGATALGRTLLVAGGAPTVTVHVSSGRSSVTGFVKTHGTAVQGAMVLLVPATLGDPAGIDTTRRDQSNTDGSFDITQVLPGKYILIAIDHGWDLNWSDPATLRRLLMKGVPLDLSGPGDRKETLESQTP